MPGIDFGLDRFGRRDPDPVMTVTQLTAAVKSAITSLRHERTNLFPLPGR